MPSGTGADGPSGTDDLPQLIARLWLVNDLTTYVADLREEIRALEDEITAYHREIVPRWSGRQRGESVETLYAYVARCFSLVDRYSLFRWPKKAQTLRMIQFLLDYVRVPSREAAQVAVAIWCHSLVHAGRPQPVHAKLGNIDYVWLLHWAEKIGGIDKHFIISAGATGSKKLDFALMYFLPDLKRAIHTYLDELENSVERRKQLGAALKKMTDEATIRDL